MTPLPSFDAGEVELLKSAVQAVLTDLKAANERLGGNDAAMIETGRRYAVLLQKLQNVNVSPPGANPRASTAEGV